MNTRLSMEFGNRGADYAKAEVRPHEDGTYYVRVYDNGWKTIAEHQSFEAAKALAKKSASINYISEIA
jgi:hypothetical protein